MSRIQITIGKKVNIKSQQATFLLLLPKAPWGEGVVLEEWRQEIKGQRPLNDIKSQTVYPMSKNDAKESW